MHGHTSCVTEHEKYAQGATKPGGFAAQGFFNEGGAPSGTESAGGAEGLQFLSTRPPWNCSICNVSCTSQDTLMGHASGAKHKRRAKAAIAAQNGGNSGANGAEQQKEEEANGTKETETDVVTLETNEKSGEKTEKKEKKKEKKSKSDKKEKKDIKWKSLAVAELKRSGSEMKSKKLLK